MALDDRTEFGDLGFGLHLFETDHRNVGLLGKLARLIEHVSDTARHAGGEVSAGGAEHDDAATGHVFAAVVAHALNHGGDAGVADGETLAGAAVDVDLTGGGAVEGHIADDDVVLGLEAGVGRRVDDEFAAGQAFAKIVVGVALDGERHAARDEGAEALAGGALETEADRVFGQTLGAEFFGDLVARDGADDTVDVFDRQLGDHFFTAVDGGLGEAEERCEVEALVEAVVLLDRAEATDLGTDVRRVKDLGEVEPLGFPVRNGALRFEPVGAPDHLLDGAETELRHKLADLGRNERHEVHDVLGLAGEFRAEPGILGRDAHRAGIEMADAHHDAARGHQWRGRKTELLGAEQCGHDHIAAGLELAVGLDGDPRAKVVQDQGLVGLGEAEFPGETGVRDGRLRR